MVNHIRSSLKADIVDEQYKYNAHRTTHNREGIRTQSL